MSSHRHIQRMQQAQMNRGYMMPPPSTSRNDGSIVSGQSGSRYNDLPPLPTQSYASKPPKTSTLSTGNNEPPRPYSASNMQASLPRSTYSASTAGRSHFSRVSLASKHSRSLNASKASLVSVQSGKSTIQQEFHDKQVISTLSSAYFGKAKTPFLIAMALYVFAVLLFITGLTLICLRYIYMNIFLTHDREEFIGPFCMAISFGFFGLGCKFLHDAYQVGNKERNRLKYVAANASYVNVVTVSARLDEPGQQLASGTATDNAITRTPHGSLSTLNNNLGTPSVYPAPGQKGGYAGSGLSAPAAAFPPPVRGSGYHNHGSSIYSNQNRNGFSQQPGGRGGYSQNEDLYDNIDDRGGSRQNSGMAYGHMDI